MELRGCTKCCLGRGCGGGSGVAPPPRRCSSSRSRTGGVRYMIARTARIGRYGHVHVGKGKISACGRTHSLSRNSSSSGGSSNTDVARNTFGGSTLQYRISTQPQLTFTKRNLRNIINTEMMMGYNARRANLSFTNVCHATAETFSDGKAASAHANGMHEERHYQHDYQYQQQQIRTDVRLIYGGDVGLSETLTKILTIYEGQKHGLYNDQQYKYRMNGVSVSESDTSTHFNQMALKEGFIKMEGVVQANTITSVLTQCRKDKRLDVATLFWEDLMKNDGVPKDGKYTEGSIPVVVVNHIHYTIYALILGTCKRQVELQQLFQQMLSKSKQGFFYPDVGAFEAFIKAGGHAEALQISFDAFDEICRRYTALGTIPHVDSISCLAVSLSAAGQFDELIKLLQRALEERWNIDCMFVGAMCQCYSKTDDWKHVMEILERHLPSHHDDSSAEHIEEDDEIINNEPSKLQSASIEDLSQEEQLGAYMVKSFTLMKAICLKMTNLEYLYGRALCYLTNARAYWHVIAMHDILTEWGAHVTLHSVTQVMVAMLKTKRPRDALRFYDKIDKKNFVPDAAVFYTKINAERHAGDWESTLETFHSMERAGFTPYPRCYHYALTAASRLSRWSLCRKLLGDMKMKEMDLDAAINIVTSGAQRAGQYKFAEDIRSIVQTTNVVHKKTSSNIYNYGVMLNAANCDEAEEILQEMKEKNITPTLVIKNILLGVYLRGKQYKKVEIVFEDMKASNEVDTISFVQMVTSLIRGGDIMAAQKVWDSMRDYNIKPNIVAYTTLIHELTNAGEEWKALHVHKEMKTHNVRPNVITYAALIKACGRSKGHKRALEFFDEMKQAGISPNVVVYQNLLWTMAQSGEPEECSRIFEHMRKSTIRPDIIAWNTYVHCTAKYGSLDDTKRLFVEMWDSLHMVSDAACISVLLAHGRAGLVDEALELLSSFKRRRMVRPSTKTLNTILNACLWGKHEQKMDKALKLFRYMKDSASLEIQANSVTYNMLMMAFNREGCPQRALDLFSEMESSNVQPDGETALTLMSCYGNLDRPDDAVKVMKIVKGKGIQLSKQAYNVMMRYYKKHNGYQEMINLFYEMKSGGINPGKGGYSRALFAAAAMKRKDLVSQLLEDMNKYYMEPDAFAYDSIMRGYLYVDEFELAATSWDTMTAKNIEPFKSSLPLAIDLLYQVDRVEDAKQLEQSLRERKYHNRGLYHHSDSPASIHDNDFSHNNNVNSGDAETLPSRENEL